MMMRGECLWVLLIATTASGLQVETRGVGRLRPTPKKDHHRLDDLLLRRRSAVQEKAPPVPVVPVVGDESSWQPSGEKKDAEKKVVMMEQMKAVTDVEGLGGLVGDLLGLAIGDKARRKLWTRADFAHAHATSGAVFLVGGVIDLAMSVADHQLWTPASAFFLASGCTNAATAVPMARFASNKLFDVTDLKSNGFVWGGAGLTTMCCWIAWWVSGAYPSCLHPLDPVFACFFSAVCLGTTINWELMLARHFDRTDRSGRKFSDDAEISLLYRLASYPNLTFLCLLHNLGAGGRAWLDAVLDLWPAQRLPLFHFAYASALGFALSMFSETLRDRNLLSLRADLLVLVFATLAPLAVVALDGCLFLAGHATIYPPDYWLFFHPEFAL